MSDPNTGPPTVESTPDPTTQTLVYTLLRAVLTIAGAIGVSTPAWASQPNALWTVAGAVAVGAGICWSLTQKYQAARADHAGSVASAKAGTPLRVP